MLREVENSETRNANARVATTHFKRVNAIIEEVPEQFGPGSLLRAGRVPGGGSTSDVEARVVTGSLGQ